MLRYLPADIIRYFLEQTMSKDKYTSIFRNKWKLLFLISFSFLVPLQKKKKKALTYRLPSKTDAGLFQRPYSVKSFSLLVKQKYALCATGSAEKEGLLVS